MRWLYGLPSGTAHFQHNMLISSHLFVALSFHPASGESEHSNPAKRRKTTAEKKAEAARKVELIEQAQAADPSAPYALINRQPWADKEAAVVGLTEEQKAHMAQLEATKMEAAGKDVETKGPTTFFHGKEQKDYQVRRGWGVEGGV